MSRTSEESILRVIGQIYDAVLEPSGWNDALDATSDILTSVDQVVLAQQCLATKELTSTTSRELAPYWTLVKDFDKRGANPLVPRMPHLTQGRIMQRAQVLADADLRKTEIYNELLEPYESIPGPAVCLDTNSDTAFYLFGHGRKLGDRLSTHEHDTLAKLVPHFQRAVRLQRHLANAGNQLAATQQSLDQLPLGVIFLDAKGHVSFCNRRAERMMEQADGLFIKHRQLTAERSTETKALREIIDDAIKTVDGHRAGSGGALSISRASLARPLSVTITPVGAETIWMESMPPVAIAFVSDPEHQEEVPEQVLMRLYGLTDAESRLTCKLLHGHSLKSAADVLGISINTAKTHQKRLFAKMGVARQAQLVGLILRSPAALSFV